MTQYTYSIFDKEENIDYRFTYTGKYMYRGADVLDFGPDLAAEYFHNHDGWDYGKTWEREGVVFHIWKPDGTYWGKFNAMIEYEPRFTVTEVL